MTGLVEMLVLIAFAVSFTALLITGAVHVGRLRMPWLHRDRWTNRVEK